ncbi:histidine kinase N-terminal 7TM domain-containing protein [Halostella salina]|uniref:histidine kinase N-terminal 7TM domain-containing protein n=1 Tax=Halostella salina TaxID=1547897 RepID=UPI0013CE52CE|nr:histidine kinase N-terminal 7TM domain-containing protein [Halostella salina]
MTAVPWPAVGAFAGGIGTLLLVAYVRRHRGKPGVNWFVAALCMQAAWALLHGVALLTFDPAARRLLETVIWVPVSTLGFLFLAFSLDYTGRGGLVRSPWFGLLAIVPGTGVALAATNSVHGLVWTGFDVEPVLGVASVDYAFGPSAYVIVAFGLAFAAVGVLLLVETVLSYGPLYRREAAAVALSAVPVAAATAAWALGVGPWQPLSLVTLSFLPHLALDAYAFVGTNMFETNPTTRRAAEEEAIEGLGNPVLVLDASDRIVDANDAARELFDLSNPSYLGASVAAAVGSGFDPARAETVTATHRGRRREYAVSVSPLSDPTGTDVGRTVVFQDVTAELRREQRLEVLNRVLRHNLRNEMTTIAGYASMIEDEAADESLGDGAAIIAERAAELVDIGERAREFEQAVEGETGSSLVAVDDVLADAAVEITREYGERVTVGAADHEIRTDPRLLRLAVENLAASLLERDDEATVELSAHATADGTTVLVAADGAALPEQEVATLRAEGERPLQHGQGIGLWIAQWSVDTLGGEVALADGTDGQVRIRLPAAEAGLNEPA